MKDIVKKDDIENKIIVIRNKQVILDQDIAALYGVETKRLNEQVKRNIDRFPESFCFQLTKTDTENLRSQIATSNDDSLRSQIATLKKAGDNIVNIFLTHLQNKVLLCFQLS